ncbi:hypothetical protein CYMTET_11036 [Cymbomonas tetramitiformis]|uniref:ABC1 atypical kinase-like domain-containing protein n=1 Tax=Cymbomonas tetramitiformis TaxID=36881 RepID=A0AAE0LD81_9CHLO|nr:hypothetical protein CYMTET_11036 [Cymbomonas tetramitiformis]
MLSCQIRQLCGRKEDGQIHQNVMPSPLRHPACRPRTRLLQSKPQPLRLRRTSHSQRRISRHAAADPGDMPPAPEVSRSSEKDVIEAPARPSTIEDPYLAVAGEYDAEKLSAFFSKRPMEVARRLYRATSVLTKAWRVWQAEEAADAAQRTRGKVLCDALSELGPVFVKVGQTMSQRKDVIGDEAASALKGLQQMNTPFDDELAYRTILEDLKHDGPLAPNFPLGVMGPPLFAHFQPGHVAAASLGQVYKARTHSGEDVAIKVLRPGVFKLVATDMHVLLLMLKTLQKLWKSKTDYQPIAVEIGTGVFRELDYHLEAENASNFNTAHAFLGFVRAPRWFPEYSGPKGTAKVLALEWINGAHLGGLSPERQMKLTRMMVDASVAQLIRTGVVHADPHEGNIMLDTEDRLVYLDFGLMTYVDAQVMEAFASGVCNLLAGNWVELAYDFRKCGIAPQQDFLRKDPQEKGKFLRISAEDFGDALRVAIEGEEKGRSQFGALAPALGGMSRGYKMLTPPYIVLLCRTFLTLEGIAAKVDPNFSVYMASLPYAVRRILSPETNQGKEALRNALLTERGDFKFQRLNEILAQVEDLADDPKQAPEAVKLETPGKGSPELPAAAEDAQGGMQTVQGLLGVGEGAALRRVMYDSNSQSLARYLRTREARMLRRMSTAKLAATLKTVARNVAVPFRSAPPLPEVIASPSSSEDSDTTAAEKRRTKRAIKVITYTHLRRLFTSGLGGIIALLTLVAVGMRVVGGAMLLVMTDGLKATYKKVLAMLGMDAAVRSPTQKPAYVSE